MADHPSVLDKSNAHIIMMPPNQRVYFNLRLTLVALAVIGLSSYLIYTKIQTLMQTSNLSLKEAFEALGKEISSFFVDLWQESRLEMIVLSTLLLGGASILVGNRIKNKINLIRWAKDAGKPCQDTPLLESEKPAGFNEKENRNISIRPGNVFSMTGWRRAEFRGKEKFNFFNEDGVVVSKVSDGKMKGHVDLSGLDKNGNGYAVMYEHQPESFQSLLSLILIFATFPWGFFLQVPTPMRIILSCMNYGTVMCAYNIGRAVAMPFYILGRMAYQKWGMKEEERAQKAENNQLFKAAHIPKEIGRSIGRAIMAPFYSVALTFTVLYGLLINPLNGRKLQANTELELNDTSTEGGSAPIDRGFGLPGFMPGWRFEGGGLPLNLGANAPVLAPCRQGTTLIEMREGRIINVTSPSGERIYDLAIEMREGDQFSDSNSGGEDNNLVKVKESFLGVPLKEKTYFIFRNPKNQTKQPTYFPKVVNGKLVKEAE